MVGIIGYGWVGKAYHKMFPEALIYDKYVPQVSATKEEINACDLAIICVPTDPKENGELDMGNIEEVVSWVKSPLILIKSALQPGTVDKLVQKTGKQIAVSVEMVGEGKYFIPYWKYPHSENPLYHQFLIIGGEDETARRCADFLWEKMSPSINIHLTTAIEAEVCKLMENFWGAQKVTFANMMYDICQDLGANYTRVLQAWGSDGRTEKMHMRVTPGKRGWKSKCYDKDCEALATLDKSGFAKAIIKTNKGHLESA